MNTYLYNVKVPNIGTILLEADDIKSARKRAWMSFRTPPRDVWRWVRKNSICEGCNSRPCCCEGV